jgi:enamine deaminase RidA (YjgF/YER057c/UK114 family)
MKKQIGTAVLLALLPVAAAMAGEGVTHYPLANGNKFPIARAVEVPAGTSLIFHSGMTPNPADPKAAMNSPAYWGDTKTQAMSAFANIKASLDDLHLGFGDVVKMLVFLAADPASKDNRMDFKGFMDAYTQYFGTPDQPNLPARSAVQVAGLAQPGMLVEIEVILARPQAAATVKSSKPKAGAQ